KIDWAQVFNTNDKFTIVLAPIVIAELDKHKYNQNRKISARARKLLPRIEAIIENSSPCRYSLKFITRRPSDETFLNHNLDKKEHDDSLLATILEHSVELTDVVILITNDSGPRLKARTLNI